MCTVQLYYLVKYKYRIVTRNRQILKFMFSLFVELLKAQSCFPCTMYSHLLFLHITCPRWQNLFTHNTKITADFVQKNLHCLHAVLKRLCKIAPPCLVLPCLYESPVMLCLSFDHCTMQNTKGTGKTHFKGRKIALLALVSALSSH